MQVRIPTPLRSYTGDQKVVSADGDTLGDVLVDLDRQFPGLRFRVVDEQGRLRKHVNVWLDSERVRDLSTRLDGVGEVVIMQALSGG